MKAVLFDQGGRTYLDDVPVPVPADDEALIRVDACGICASDLHMAQIKEPGELSWPIIAGHEIAGTITRLGAAVAGFLVGDRVAVNPLLTCGSCRACRKGQINLCQRPDVIGLRRPGGFAEYVSAPAGSLHAVADLSPTAAALAEPLACALHGVRRLAPRAGDSILIVGAGSIGLLALQLLRRLTQGPIVIADLSEQRLEVARQLGATQVLPAAANLASTLRDLAPDGFDGVIDATGVPLVVQTALEQVAAGGRMLMLGSCPRQATIEVAPRQIQRQEITMLGSFSFRDEFPDAVQMLIAGEVAAGPIVTHTFRLESFAAAIKAAQVGGTTVKAAFTPAA